MGYNVTGRQADGQAQHGDGCQENLSQGARMTDWDPAAGGQSLG